MDKDEAFLKARFIELAEQSYQRNIPVHTDFLNLYEQNLFYSIVSELPPVCYELMGGYNLSERKCVVFSPSEFGKVAPVYKLLRISPLDHRFTEDLTHRDFLGAVMGLGIKREQLGDLVLSEDSAYLFCFPSLAEFITEELSSVKHTPVSCEEIAVEDFKFEPRMEEIQCSVSSVRLDAILSQGFHISRNHAIPYIEEGKVFVNGRLITTNAYGLKEGDLISVRGLGKLQYNGTLGNSKKGRLIVSLFLYT